MSGKSILASKAGVARVQRALHRQRLDGWLLFEFRGENSIAASILDVARTTRRAFVLVPREGEPRALVHTIEHSAWRSWPWRIEAYAGWREMERRLAELVAGKRDLALEFSPGSAVPTVDAVPGGLLELLRGLGVEPSSSGNLVSEFHSVWSEEQLEEHRRAGERIASVARRAFAQAADAVMAGSPTTEGALSRWILGAMAQAGVAVDADTHVAVGPRAADPHYTPSGEGEPITRDQLLLIDLWGRTTEQAVHADQTWMGYLGDELPADVAKVWAVVRRARDTAVAFLRERFSSRKEVLGLEVDDVARRVVEVAGYGDYFIHRTGHSIDTKLHGSGPNLDNLETRDERRLVEGVGFSVEPGIYLPNRFGVRSEINVHWGVEGPEVTPREPQDAVFLLLKR